MYVEGRARVCSPLIGLSRCSVQERFTHVAERKYKYQCKQATAGGCTFGLNLVFSATERKAEPFAT